MVRGVRYSTLLGCTTDVPHVSISRTSNNRYHSERASAGAPAASRAARGHPPLAPETFLNSSQTEIPVAFVFAFNLSPDFWMYSVKSAFMEKGEQNCDRRKGMFCWRLSKRLRASAVLQRARTGGERALTLLLWFLKGIRSMFPLEREENINLFIKKKKECKVKMYICIFGSCYRWWLYCYK